MKRYALIIAGVLLACMANGCKAADEPSPTIIEETGIKTEKKAEDLMGDLGASEAAKGQDMDNAMNQ